MSEYPPKPGSTDEAGLADDKAKREEDIQRGIVEDDQSLISIMIDAADTLARESGNDGNNDKWQSALGVYSRSAEEFGALLRRAKIGRAHV